jgi:hypothetical protein
MAKGKITVKAKGFLAAYERCGTIAQASRTARVNRWAHFCWMERWPHYPALFEKARERAEKIMADRCTREAERRAVKGMKKVVRDNHGKAVFDWVDDQGQVIPPDEVDTEQRIHKVTGVPVRRQQATENKYSDVLMIFLLKKLDPSFRDNHHVEIGGQLSHTHRIDEARVKQILADRESADLANNLARRVAVLASSPGEPSN